MPWLLLQPELLGPLFIIFGALVLIGLAQTLTSQHGSDQSHSLWYYISGQQYWQQLTGFAAKFARYVVSRFASAHLRTLSHWFRALGNIAIGAFAVQADFAEATEKALQSLFVNGDRLARREAAAARRLAVDAAHVGHRALSMARSDLTALHKFEAKIGAQVHSLTHAIDVTIPRELGRIRGDVRVAEKDIAGLRGDVRALEDGAINTFRWLSAHRTGAAMAAFTGAVAWALTRMGFGFLRCNSWKSVGKRLNCGMGSWLLGLLDLIATFGLALLGVLRPQVLAEEAVAAVDGIEYILRQILDN